MEAARLTFWDYARAVIDRRRLIVLNVIVIMIVAVVIASFLPRWYKATALILPPEKGNDFSGLIGTSGLAGLAASGGFALPVLATESDVMERMLKSRSVINSVIDSLDLMRVYESGSYEQTRKRILSNLKVNVGRDGIIEVAYVDKDSVRSAGVANAIIVMMDRLRTELAIQKARATKMFVEQKLRETEDAISVAEDSLKAFQKEYKIIAPEVQATATITAAADLRALMISEQIKLNSLRLTHRPNHPKILLLRNTIDEMNNKIKELESGLVGIADTSAQYLSIPFSDVPDLSLRYGQLTRNLKIQERVFEMLTEQYERAKIQETRETPTISVLDWAVPPMSKFKPKRATIGLSAGFLTLLATLAWIFLCEFWARHRNSDTLLYQNISGISRTLRRDLFGIRRKKV